MGMDQSQRKQKRLWWGHLQQVQVSKKVLTRHQCEKSPPNPLQDLNMLGWQACVLLHAVQQINTVSWLSACSCRARILPGSQRQDWSYAKESSDSWGKAAQEVKERELPFTWQSSWRAWSSVSGRMRSNRQGATLWVRIKEGRGKVPQKAKQLGLRGGSIFCIKISLSITVFDFRKL